MSYTSDQLAALRAAYASGVTEVRDADGRTVRYGSLGDLSRAIATLEREVEGTTRLTHVNPVFVRDV